MIHFSNFSSTNLASAVAPSDTVIHVVDSSSFPATPFYIICDIEIMIVTAVGGTAWTVTRAQESTVAAYHASATKIDHGLTAGSLTTYVSDAIAAIPADVDPPSGMQHLSDDLTPSLGGNLSLGGHNIGGVTPTELGYVSGATSSIQTQLGTKANTSSLSTVATSGAYADLSGKPSLATVATTGSYSDLSGKPSLGTAAALDAGSANGVATLDGGGKVPSSQIPAAIVSGLEFMGLWNSSTNSPALSSGVGTKGTLYKVSVSGSTALDGITTWLAGDLLFYDGSVWDKIDGNPSEVVSVAGRTGAVTLAYTDVSGISTVGHTGVYADLSAKPSLATVATSGAYADLSGKPTLGTAAALDVGTTSLHVVQLDGSAHLPAVDGSALTGLTKTQVGLGSVPNTDCTNATNIASGTLADARLSSNVTLQTNTFNIANKLVKLDNSARLPALDGSALAGVTAFNLTGFVSGTGFPAKISGGWAARTITGTANQVNVSNGDGYAGDPTLSLPQNIATGSNVAFQNLNIADTIQTSTINASVVGCIGSVYCPHFIGGGGSPSVTADFGLGSGPSTGVVGHDCAGLLTLSTGSLMGILVETLTAGVTEVDDIWSLNWTSSGTFTITLDGSTLDTDTSLTASDLQTWISGLGYSDCTVTDAGGGAVPYTITFSSGADRAMSISNDTGAGASLTLSQLGVQGVQEVQRIVLPPCTGGVWGTNGSSTGLAFNDDATAVQVNLNGFTSGVTVTGTFDTSFTVTWNAFGPQSVILADGSGLTGVTLSEDVAQLVYYSAYGVAPYVVVTAANANACGIDLWIDSATDKFTVHCPGGLAVSTEYIWHYQVIG